jgi:hypothetical protein
LVETDDTTGKRVGWVTVSGGPEDKWHREALQNDREKHSEILADGTYELCGPKVQGNPEDYSEHTLIRHGSIKLDEVPRTFDTVSWWLHDHSYEGVVWHHPDGRMAKIKKKDFPNTREGKPR